MRRFFDYFLKGEGDWETQPPVSLQVRHADGTFTQRGQQEWPLAHTAFQRCYLDVASESMSPTLPELGRAAYAAAGEGLTLRSPALTEQLELTGPVSARLWVSSSSTDADLILVLRAFAPDGSEVLFQGANDPKTPLSQGWLRLSHRALDVERSREWAPWHPHEHADAVAPGQIYPVDVEIWATCVVLPAGYQLALSILGRDFDHGLEPAARGAHPMRGSGPFRHEHPEDRPAATFDNEVTVYTGGATASSILLPVVSGSLPGSDS